MLVLSVAATWCVSHTLRRLVLNLNPNSNTCAGLPGTAWRSLQMTRAYCPMWPTCCAPRCEGSVEGGDGRPRSWGKGGSRLIALDDECVLPHVADLLRDSRGGGSVDSLEGKRKGWLTCCDLRCGGGVEGGETGAPCEPIWLFTPSPHSPSSLLIVQGRLKYLRLTLCTPCFSPGNLPPRSHSPHPLFIPQGCLKFLRLLYRAMYLILCTPSAPPAPSGCPHLSHTSHLHLLLCRAA